MKKLRKNLFTYSLNHFFTSKNAFTLTEVLVALTIVGVISALVLPAVVTRYQEKAFDNAYRRETQMIESAVDELVVSENKVSFFDTMMYKDTEPEDYDDSSKVFVNKYLRASKICATGSDCFAKKYYTYEDNDKKVYVPEFKGTCAKLKNGASICIQPQIGGVPIKGIIDINGDKGPNVLGKDLRAFAFTTWTRNGKNNEVAVVLDTNFTPIGTTDPCEGMTCGCGDLPECDPCEGQSCGCGDLPPCTTSCNANPSEWDESCCLSNSASVTSKTHHCCSYSSVKTSNPHCPQLITFKVEDTFVGFDPSFDMDMSHHCKVTITPEAAKNKFRLLRIVKDTSNFANEGVWHITGIFLTDSDFVVRDDNTGGTNIKVTYELYNDTSISPSNYYAGSRTPIVKVRGGRPQNCPTEGHCSVSCNRSGVGYCTSEQYLCCTARKQEYEFLYTFEDNLIPGE